MYTLGSNTLKSYGVRVTSCRGLLDFTERKEIDNFSYFDTDGEEPYTDSDMILFRERTIDLTCFYRAATGSFLTGWDTFITLLKSSGLKNFPSPYSSHTHSVYVSEPFDVTEVSRRTAAYRAFTFRLRLTEPVPDDFSTYTPTPISATTDIWAMDGYSLKDSFGIKIEKCEGLYDMPALKKYPTFNNIFVNGDRSWTGSDNLHYESRDLKLYGYLVQDSSQDAVDQFNSFKWLLFQENMRILNVPGDNNIFNVYCKNGGTAEMLKGHSSKFIIRFILNLKYVNNIDYGT